MNVNLLIGLTVLNILSVFMLLCITLKFMHTLNLIAKAFTDFAGIRLDHRVMTNIKVLLESGKFKELLKEADDEVELPL